jgi:uncharacterized RDD family membrane protein YckC
MRSSSSINNTEFPECWARLLAFVVDLGIIVLFYSLLSVPLGFVYPLFPREERVIVLPLAWIFATPIIYFAVFESSIIQATPGKILLRLKVTDINGNRLSIARSFVRSFVRVLTGLVPLLWLISFAIAAFTPRKQALHDLIVRTLVLKG